MQVQINPKSFELRGRWSFFYPGRTNLMITSVLCCFHSLFQYPNLSEGADSIIIDRQLPGDKIECPFNGITNSDRVWKVPESDIRSVSLHFKQTPRHTLGIAFWHRRKDVANQCLEFDPKAHSEHRFPTQQEGCQNQCLEFDYKALVYDILPLEEGCRKARLGVCFVITSS